MSIFRRVCETLFSLVLALSVMLMPNSLVQPPKPAQAWGDEAEVNKPVPAGTLAVWRINKNPGWDIWGGRTDQQFTRDQNSTVMIWLNFASQEAAEAQACKEAQARRAENSTIAVYLMGHIFDGTCLTQGGAVLGQAGPPPPPPPAPPTANQPYVPPAGPPAGGYQPPAAQSYQAQAPAPQGGSLFPFFPPWNFGLPDGNSIMWDPSMLEDPTMADPVPVTRGTWLPPGYAAIIRQHNSSLQMAWVSVIGGTIGGVPQPVSPVPLWIGSAPDGDPMHYTDAWVRKDGQPWASMGREACGEGVEIWKKSLGYAPVEVYLQGQPMSKRQIRWCPDP